MTALFAVETQHGEAATIHEINTLFTSVFIVIIFEAIFTGGVYYLERCFNILSPLGYVNLSGKI